LCKEQLLNLKKSLFTLNMQKEAIVITSDTLCNMINYENEALIKIIFQYYLDINIIKKFFYSYIKIG